MIDFEREELLTMAEAARRVPKQPHVATLWRWRRTGVAGVKLETICLGGTGTYTSREALDRFFERVTAVKNGASTPSRASRQRERAMRAAGEELIAAGLLDRPLRVPQRKNSPVARPCRGSKRKPRPRQEN